MRRREKWGYASTPMPEEPNFSGFFVIKRFSEDIDLILDWRLIKYGIDEPWEERSHNQQDKFNKQMIKTTAEYLESIFVPAVG